MKLKSLLLGTAATMVAVSGAQAADAIVVEPEPVEYVKVCDTYGAGYFYIPGTETCLKIGGYVRINYASAHTHDDGTISHHRSYARALFSFDAKNETEYGTLGSSVYLRFQKTEAGELDGDPGNHDVFSTSEPFNVAGSHLWRATINLAGFRAGFDATSGGAQNRYAGFGFYNANHSGAYGFDTALFFEYGGSIGDINYVVGIQDSALSGASGQPDPYVGISGSMGDLSFGAVAIYDHGGYGVDLAKDPTGATSGTIGGGLYYRLRADYDLSSMMPGASIGGWYRADDGDTDYVKGHQWGITAKADIMEGLNLFGGYSDWDHQGDPALDNDSTRFRHWTVGVRWTVADGLYIQPEYNKVFLDEETDNGIESSSAGVFNLRIHRSF